MTAKQIKEHRERLGISAIEYGFRAGVSGSHMRNIEKGYVPLSRKIEKLLLAAYPELGGQT